MKANTKATGRFGEEEAEKFLRRKGYQILSRNFYTRFGEIDLICQDKNVTVFVEVKTKTGLEFGLPEEMFTQSKMAKVKRMAQMYIRGKDRLCRIDMVSVVLDNFGKVAELRHYENVT